MPFESRLFCSLLRKLYSPPAVRCTIFNMTINVSQKCLFSTARLSCAAQIIDGRKMAAEVRAEVKDEISKWVAKGHRPPRLGVILVGSDPASATYVNNKLKAAKKVGIESVTDTPYASIYEEELGEKVETMNNDPNIDGILVQLPLPAHINERKICNMISPRKDVDGFHIANVGRFVLDMRSLMPCTPMAVRELIQRTGIPTFGKNAVVCGRSKNVGFPIAVLLHADGIGETLAMDATTTICHRYTPREQLKVFAQTADIIVTAAGVPNLITADMVKEGVAVIDVGINRVFDAETGKSRLVGDVDFESVSKKASYITPVPGGVGPMTVAMLMRNTLLAATNNIGY